MCFDSLHQCQYYRRGELLQAGVLQLDLFRVILFQIHLFRGDLLTPNLLLGQRSEGPRGDSYAPH
jgi:hypothetical protein